MDRASLSLSLRFFNFFFFFFLEKHVSIFSSGSHALFKGPINLIKNGSQNTIHTFKNYFAMMFSVFSKISGIQTHPKCAFGYQLKNQLILLFSLFLLLFICLTILFHLTFTFIYSTFSKKFSVSAK